MSTTPTSPTASSATAGTAALTAEQTAGTWTLLSIQPTGEAEQLVPAGAPYSLTFADGRVSATADCNACRGAVAVGSETLTIGPLLACTRAACPTMDFEARFVALVAGDSAARVDGASLTLTSPRGTLRFHR